jgi:hypothetical protein
LQPFGLVSKIVMLRAKNQALLQMEDIHASVSALQYYSSVQPSVRGRNVYMQFSSHQELTTDQSSHGRNSDQVRHAILYCRVIYCISQNDTNLNQCHAIDSGCN